MENILAKYDDQAVAWPDIGERERELPDFPMDALPERLRGLVEHMAEAMQAPAGMVAAFAIGVASAAVVGRVEIYPKPNAEPFYAEPAQLFVLCEGASGERKTPVLNALKTPLEEWLEENRKAVAAKNQQALRRIKALERGLGRERDIDKGVEMQAEIDALREKLAVEPEYCQADLTMESLCACMNEHGGRAIVLHDEADFLQALAGKAYQREGAAVNLLPVLAGYNNSAYHGKRITRGEWHIVRCSLAICLGVQPRLLRDFMGYQDGNDRGLHGRCLYFCPESRIGSRSDQGGSIPSADLAWWARTIDHMAGMGREEKPCKLPFDRYAEAAYRSFFRDIEAMLPGELGGVMQAWGGKLCGNTARLAGIFALLEGADHVGRSHWDCAEALAVQYLIPCAKSLFLGGDPNLSDDAKKLLPKIKKLDSFSSSEFRDKYARNMPADDVRCALDCLAVRGYIRPAAQQPDYCGKGRRPSTVYDVNPQLHKRQADSGEVEW